LIQQTQSNTLMIIPLRLCQEVDKGLTQQTQSNTLMIIPLRLCQVFK
jgi:hypothetical protein